MKKIFLWLIIIVEICFFIIQSHIFTSLIFNNQEKINFYLIQDTTIIIKPDTLLDSNCYYGSLNNLKNKEIYIWTLNYLCKEYNIRNVKIKELNDIIILDNNIMLLAKTNFFGISFYYNAINLYFSQQWQIYQIVFHEYIHLIMYRNMSNYFTINYKSQQLIDNSLNNFYNIPKQYYYPTEYSYISSTEQIAEILSFYFTKRIYDNNVSNFEQDLWNQFKLNF